MKRLKINFMIILLIYMLTGCTSEEAQSVIDEINTIGEVSITSGKKLNEINDKYQQLSEEDKKSVENYNILLEARKEYNIIYAESFDNRIISACGSSATEEKINNLISEYNKMDTETKELVKNYERLEETKDELETKRIYTEILMSDYSQSSSMLSKIKSIADDLDETELTECLMIYGELRSLYYATEFIKEDLKSPKSFNLYSADKVDTKLDKDTYEWCTIYEIKYGATNSFGAEVTSTVTVYVYYDINRENVSVDFTRVKYSAGDALLRSLN